MEKMYKTEKKAVALKYPEGCIAPIITAKGNGIIAEKILSEAKKNNILITEDNAIINMLDSCSPGEIIPENAWEVIAVLFSFILEEK